MHVSAYQGVKTFSSDSAIADVINCRIVVNKGIEPLVKAIGRREYVLPKELFCKCQL